MELTAWIARCAQTACYLEASAPKPGNVTPQHRFSDLCYEDFLLSAHAIGPALSRVAQEGVGRTIWQAVRDTRQLVGTNTNLGIVLLLAPLAKACCLAPPPRDLREGFPPEALRAAVRQALAGLTVEDARWAYAAIRHAQPGGMGKAPEGDLAEEPTITLLEAMALAQERDAIAREYVTGFATTFEIGYPAVRAAWSACCDPAASVVQAFLTLLANAPDTLIARKRGMEDARQVSAWAAEALALGGALTAAGQAALKDLDHRLRDERHSLNPGTTADLTTAALFLFLTAAC
jgi:triphosphoribosyl-dephospho-CoA synthase